MLYEIVERLDLMPHHAVPLIVRTDEIPDAVLRWKSSHDGRVAVQSPVFRISIRNGSDTILTQKMQHIRNGVTYAPVWQTWNVVRPQATPTSTIPDKGRSMRPSSEDVGVATSSLRERMQIARIERRMTIDDLANALKCDAETLAGFERGDEILPESLQKTIRRVLNL